MKILQLDTNYYKFPEGIKTADEFAKFANNSSQKFVKLTMYSEEHCMEPYFIEEDKRMVWVNLSQITYIEEIDGELQGLSGTLVKIGTDLYHRFGPYTFDNDAPDVTFAPNEALTYEKQHSVEVTIKEIGYAGIDINSLKYLWIQGTTTPDLDYMNANGTSFAQSAEGATSGTEHEIKETILTPEGETGLGWYLWILTKDTLGYTNIISSGEFRLDNNVLSLFFST